MLGSLGIPELLFIFGLALLIFGPKRLPEVGRALGKGMAELRKASNDLKRTINAEMIEQEIRDNDPRRIVRDSLQDVKKSLTVDLYETPNQGAKLEPGDDGKKEGREKDGGPSSGEGARAGEESREDSKRDEASSIEGSVARGSVTRQTPGEEGDTEKNGEST